MATEWIINIQREWKSTDAEREEEKRSRICTYRVPKYKKDLDSNAYAPQVLSLGPYNHHFFDGEHFKLMDLAKRRILEHYLDKVGVTLETVVSAMKKEARALMDAYDGLEEPWTDEDRFVELMILDGCCLLQLLLYKGNFSDCIDEKLRLCGAIVAADVLLLENQLPLRLLQILLDIGGEKIEAVDALQLVGGFLPDKYNSGDTPQIGCHILDVLRTKILGDGDFVYDGQGDVKVASLAELADFGVRLKKRAVGCLRSITFDGSVLRLPCIPLDILTESLLLNFVAFEQLHGLHTGAGTNVLSFLRFMDRLVDSRGDDELLRRNMALLERRGIIRGWTESDADLAALFHGTVKEHQVLLRRKSPESNGVSVDKELIQYCKKKCPRFRAFCIRASRGWLVKSILGSLFLIMLHSMFPSVKIEKL